MGVVQQLGLEAEGDSALLVLAGERWLSWVDVHRSLATVGGVSRLRPWLGSVGAGEADRVLHALVSLAAVDGGDDQAAAATVAWALVPGACTLATRLRTLSPRVDEIVASQLWVEIRTFPWQRLRKVAANVLLNTRAGVLRECGAAAESHTRLLERRTIAVAPDDWLWSAVAAHSGLMQEARPAASEELYDVLRLACDSKVITDEDRTLLLSLVRTADRLESGHSDRPRRTLTGCGVAEAVATEWGISSRTVRRRAHRSIRALCDARADLNVQVCA